MIYHYLQVPTGSAFDEAAIRIITTNMSVAAKAAYEASVATKDSAVKIEGSSYTLMAINTGDMKFALLEKMIAERDVNFRIASFPISVLENIDYASMIGRANFAYANSSRALFVSFGEGVNKWGLESVGLKVSNGKKLTKRLNELLRLTKWSYDGPFFSRAFETPEGEDHIFYDGSNFMSRHLANKMGIRPDVVRTNVRWLSPAGLVKGDCNIVEELDCDFVYHTENIKHELCTDGFSLIVAAEHAPYHEVRYDDQTLANFGFFLTKEMVMGDLAAMEASYREAVTTGGEIHNYLSDRADVYSEDICVDMEAIQLSDTLDAQCDALSQANIPPSMFSNLVYTRLGALIRKMDARRIPGTKAFKATFIPARNAFLGAVTTFEAARNMANFTFEDHISGERTFFHPEIGLVVPGSRFKSTYDLHGGHDADDTWAMFAIKVFCSDPEAVDSLIASGILDPALRDISEPVLAGLAIRRPNGPGEYSIEAIENDMPWAYYNEDSIPVVDLAHAPLSQSEVFENTHFDEIPSSINYESDYSQIDAIMAMSAQMNNPGIGSFANVLIAWSSTFGHDSVPSSMIGTMEDVVDVLEQTCDEEAFVAIASNVRSLWIEFANKVISEKVPVDPILLRTRIPLEVGIGDDKVSIGSAIVAAKMTARTRLSATQAAYGATIERIRDLSMHTANAVRQDIEMTKQIRATKFGKELYSWADGWFKMAIGQLRQIDNQFNARDFPDANAIVRRQFQTQRRHAMEKMMLALVNSIKENRFDTHDCILALYKYIVTPTPKFTNGHMDRILVQPCPQGETSMLSLFVEAVAMKGWLD